jgi:hypothetical protein
MILRERLEDLHVDWSLGETVEDVYNLSRSIECVKLLGAWKEDYNRQRPHSPLGNITLIEFAMKMAMEKQAAYSQIENQRLSEIPEETWVSGQPARSFCWWQQ